MQSTSFTKMKGIRKYVTSTSPQVSRTILTKVRPLIEYEGVHGKWKLNTSDTSSSKYPPKKKREAQHTKLNKN